MTKKPEEMIEEEKIVKAKCTFWNNKEIQEFIAKILYQLLLPLKSLHPESEFELETLKEIELVVFKEYIKKILDEDYERTKRLLLLYCVMAGDYIDKDKVIWDKINEMIKQHSSLEIVDRCVICKEKINLFVVKSRSVPIKVGSIVSKDDLQTGRIINCPKKHPNLIILSEVKIKNVEEIAYECSKCKFIQKPKAACLMCGSYCHKLL